MTIFWTVEYKKGLAALEDGEYREIIHNPNLVQLTNDKQAAQSLDDWFGNDSAPRKARLLQFSI